MQMWCRCVHTTKKVFVSLPCEWNQYKYTLKWDTFTESTFFFSLSWWSLFQPHLSRALASMQLRQCNPLSFQTSLQQRTPNNFWWRNCASLAEICRTQGSTNGTISAVWNLEGTELWNRLGGNANLKERKQRAKSPRVKGMGIWGTEAIHSSSVLSFFSFLFFFFFFFFAGAMRKHSKIC